MRPNSRSVHRTGKMLAMRKNDTERALESTDSSEKPLGSTSRGDAAPFSNTHRTLCKSLRQIHSIIADLCGTTLKALVVGLTNGVLGFPWNWVKVASSPTVHSWALGITEILSTYGRFGSHVISGFVEAVLRSILSIPHGSTIVKWLLSLIHNPEADS